MRRPVALFTGAAVIVATLTGLWFTTRGDTTAADAENPADGNVETALVVREDLEQTEDFTATLGYGDTFSLPGQAFGTVTWVPDEGAILEPGDLLYRVDERPTHWATGTVPTYRTLERGAKGDDVAQLERFLQSEGYLDDGAEVDGTFDAALTAAVKQWQDDHGLEDTGRIDATQLLFLPYDGLRVAGAPRVGDAANGGILDVTLDDLSVSADLDAAGKRAFEGDPTIEVEFADGTRHPADVTSITAAEERGPTGGQLFHVVLAVNADPRQQPANVGVAVTDVLAENALTVPIHALLARAGGNWAVEVVDDAGERHLEEVKIGAFANGRVAVTGDLSAGDHVVVPT